MSRIRSVRKQNESDGIEQRTWAGLDQIAFSQEVVGFGEALSEPIYFGRAFSSPPQFTYSAVADSDFDTSGDVVKSLAWPAKELMEAPSAWSPNGKASSFQSYGFWADPSFEVHGEWDTYIPRSWEWERWVSYQKITAEQGIPLSGGVWRFFEYGNFWVQSFSPSDDYWVVTDENAAAPRPGGKSAFSAKCVIGSDGYTPWLQPIFNPENSTPFEVFDYLDPVYTDVGVLDNIFSWIHPLFLTGELSGGYYPGGYFEVKDNPPLGETTFSIKAYAEDAVLESYVGWFDNSRFGDKYPPYAYYVPKEETETFSVSGNAWQTFEQKFTLPDAYWPEISDIDDYYDDYVYGLFRFRLKGTPGDTVYVDEIYGWTDLSTRQAIPFITIGVAEWILDEKDMYVGAILWYKVTNGKPNA